MAELIPCRPTVLYREIEERGIEMHYSHIKVDPLSPTIGAMISGIDLNNVKSEAAYNEIKQALWKHHVVFFRDQNIKPDAYLELGRQFGEMEKHEFFPHLKDYPQIQTLTHEGYERPETDRWHTDVTFRQKPNMVSILRAVDIPESGGDTAWMSTGAAFDALGDALKTMLLSLDAEHDLPYRFRKTNTYSRLGGDEMSSRERELKLIAENPPQVHPAVINHPVTNRLTLFVNAIWTKRLLGVHEDLSDSLLTMLNEWVKKPEFVVRFRWEPNSMAIWDNFATQHYAVFDYGPHYRAMQRMTAGSAAPTLDRHAVPSALRPPSWPGTQLQSSGASPSSLLDRERLSQATPPEREAVTALFDALDQLDLDRIVANAGK